ncbi:response regulator [Gallaecimonas mangrovi]|uniref:response regulator n=1 Tax=Gallaecimonas mangrovi TaxID=2291597 RepID=UPI000E2016DC|nr:response regulator [Gallaecimonas mangrovi]
MTQILVVDDEMAIRRFLRLSLKAEGYEVVEADTVNSALAACQRLQPDLVVLDLGLPDGDGSQVLSAIRQQHSWPVLVLSVRESEQEKVRLLDAGANDYMTKPFGIQEFMARIRVLLRQQPGSTQAGVLRIDKCALRLDTQSHQLWLADQQVNLSKKEFALLAMLLRHAGQVLIQSQLLTEIWGPTHKEDSHYLRIVVANLRKKLADDPLNPKLIETLPGIGYRFIGG